MSRTTKWLTSDRLHSSMTARSLESCSATSASLPFALDMSSSPSRALKEKLRKQKQVRQLSSPDLHSFSGANERIRTADLRITSALLYQLSHVGKRVKHKLQTRK